MTLTQQHTAQWSFECGLEIHQPIELVFDFVADPRRDPLWCPRVRSCRQVEGDGPAVGARYEVFHNPTFQRPHLRHIEVTEFARPNRIRSRQEDHVGLFEISYELSSEPEGTRILQHDDIEWRIPRAYLPIATRIVRRHMRDQLQRLKRLLEEDPATAHDP